MESVRTVLANCIHVKEVRKLSQLRELRVSTSALFKIPLVKRRLSFSRQFRSFLKFRVWVSPVVW